MEFKMKMVKMFVINNEKMNKEQLNSMSIDVSTLTE